MSPDTRDLVNAFTKGFTIGGGIGLIFFTGFCLGLAAAERVR